MSKFQPISDQEKHDKFVEIFNLYRANNKIKDVKAYCSEIDYTPNTLWLILAGKRMVPNILIYKFCESFNINPAYFFGRSSSYSYDESSQINELLTDLSNLVNKYSK
jgi:hypothetical protein